MVRPLGVPFMIRPFRALPDLSELTYVPLLAESGEGLTTEAGDPLALEQEV